MEMFQVIHTYVLDSAHLTPLTKADFFVLILSNNIFWYVQHDWVMRNKKIWHCVKEKYYKFKVLKQMQECFLTLMMYPFPQ